LVVGVDQTTHDRILRSLDCVVRLSVFQGLRSRPLSRFNSPRWARFHWAGEIRSLFGRAAVTMRGGVSVMLTAVFEPAEGPRVRA
jgi:hypothetical protein